LQTPFIIKQEKGESKFFLNFKEKETKDLDIDEINQKFFENF
jgi:hypothetical protein